MSAPGPPPLIVTLRLDDESFAWLDALRQQHFPPERNYLRAHLTLFHKLPGEEEAAVAGDLAEAARRAPVPLVFPEPMFLGRGVAVRVGSPVLPSLRARLAGQWHAWLSPQDRQGFRPHVTIQNKVEPPVARRLYDAMEEAWEERRGTGVGLSLWRYLDGPWGHVQDFMFG